MPASGISRLLALTALSLKDLEFGANFQSSDKRLPFLRVMARFLLAIFALEPLKSANQPNRRLCQSGKKINYNESCDRKCGREAINFFIFDSQMQTLGHFILRFDRFDVPERKGSWPS